MKKLFCVFAFVLMILLISPTLALAKAKSENEIYNEQLKNSGANSLKEKLPEETSKALEEFGVHKVDWHEIINISPEKVFACIYKIVKKISPSPIKCAFCTLSVILICAFMDTFKTKISEQNLSFTLSTISSLCICASLALPLVGFIGRACTVVNMASAFMFSFIPILAAIMLSSGQTVTAGSYQLLMMFVSQGISYLSSSVLMPMLNSLLTLSVVSSISQKVNVSGITSFFYKIIKWILSFFMTVFVSLLTIQGLIGTSADNIGTKAARFMISNFVPVVGRALSDAFTTVQSCMKLLKSSVGAFGIIASEFIFLPVIIEAALWLMCVHFCSAISDIFSLKKVSLLLINCSKVISTTLSIVLCFMMILVISSVIVLIISSNVI